MPIKEKNEKLRRITTQTKYGPLDRTVSIFVSSLRSKMVQTLTSSKFEWVGKKKRGHHERISIELAIEDSERWGWSVEFLLFGERYN